MSDHPGTPIKAVHCLSQAGHVPPVNMIKDTDLASVGKYPTGNAGDWLELQVTGWLLISSVIFTQTTGIQGGNSNL